jgi:protein-histidine N-methyltransferase
VAFKRVYFGVGGGEVEFEQCAAQHGGRVNVVWQGGAGVGRKIDSVVWT